MKTIVLWLLWNELKCTKSAHRDYRHRGTRTIYDSCRFDIGRFVWSRLIYEKCLHLSDKFAYRSAHNNLFLTLRVIHKLKRGTTMCSWVHSGILFLLFFFLFFSIWEVKFFAWSPPLQWRHFFSTFTLPRQRPKYNDKFQNGKYVSPHEMITNMAAFFWKYIFKAVVTCFHPPEWHFPLSDSHKTFHHSYMKFLLDRMSMKV